MGVPAGQALAQQPALGGGGQSLQDLRLLPEVHLPSFSHGPSPVSLWQVPGQQAQAFAAAHAICVSVHQGPSPHTQGASGTL